MKNWKCKENLTNYGDTKYSGCYLVDNWCSHLTLLIWFPYQIHSKQTTYKHHIGGSHILWFTLLACTYNLHVCIWFYNLSLITKVFFNISISQKCLRTCIVFYLWNTWIRFGYTPKIIWRFFAKLVSPRKQSFYLTVVFTKTFSLMHFHRNVHFFPPKTLFLSW